MEVALSAGLFRVLGVEPVQAGKSVFFSFTPKYPGLMFTAVKVNRKEVVLRGTAADFESLATLCENELASGRRGGACLSLQRASEKLRKAVFQATCEHDLPAGKPLYGVRWRCRLCGKTVRAV